LEKKNQGCYAKPMEDHGDFLTVSSFRIAQIPIPDRVLSELFREYRTPFYYN